MRVLFLGRLRDIAGASEIAVDAPVATVADLRRWVSRGNEALAAALDQPSVRVAVDRMIVAGDAHLRGPEEVAFLPPMSGG